MRDLQDLDAIAEAVADGTPLDWDRIEAVAPDERSRTLVRNLRSMAAMAGLHRTMDGDADPPEPAAMRTAVATVDRPLRMWGHFALEQHIGSGSFGDVFRAIDTRLDRMVAVKLARAELRDPDAMLIEARLLARVRHPNVASVYGADTFDGQPGLWMEFIEGQTLSSVLLRQGPLSEAEAAVMGLDLCRALAAVHAAGLLHRDIKAQNVMRESGGRIVLMDFGGGREVASDRRLGGDTGTPLYLAPEVLGGQPASARSDVYALGVLLYYLVTREFPVKAVDALGLTAAHGAAKRVSVTERRPDLSPRFVRLVERATAVDPEARYESAGAMAADLASVLHPENEAVAAPAPPPPRRLSPMLIAAAGVLLAVAVGVGLWTAFGGRPSGASAIGSILVLPLNDDSRETAQGYVAAGFTNMLAEDLGLVRSLRIITSSQARNRPDADPAGIARDVGADAYLQGGVRRSGDRILLTVRLIDTDSGAVQWSGSFDRPAHEGLSLNREVARAIADELGVATSPEESRALNTRFTVSAAAQDAYLRGWAEYQRLSRDGSIQAVREFEEAIKLQPTFAAAHAALSYVYWRLGTSFRIMPREESRSKAEASALRALELDPTLANAHAALGQVRFYFDWNWSYAEELFRRARELNPNIANVRMQYGWLLAAMGRTEPALQELRAAVALEPHDVGRRVALATTLYYAHRYPAAIEEIERVIALDPNAPVGHLGKARFLAESGRAEEALGVLALARFREEPAVQAEFARIHVKAGNADEARRMLPDLTTATHDGRLAKDYLAFVHAALGESGQALALLEAALAERSPTLVWVQADPRFDALRSDVRFANVLRQMGFEQ